MTASHSLEFRRGLSSIVKGDVLVPPLRAWLSDPDFKGLTVTVPPFEKREPDGWFHPSTHPLMPERVLWLYLVVPEMLMEEPLDHGSVLALTVGTIWHTILEGAMIALGLVDEVEVRFEHPETLSKGSADGVRGDELIEIKGLALDTPIPTPDGWTTMRDLNEGDAVFGANGEVCRVTAMSSERWKQSYVIHFDDGSSITADGEHRWLVSSGQASRQVERVLTTEEIAATLRANGQSQHRIMNARPLVLDDAKLPIDPYLMGAWLGDGSRHNGAITSGKGETAIWDVLRSRGHKIGEPWGDDQSSDTRTIFGLRTKLVELGLLGAPKRIPPEYMRASLLQRLDLLRGLMDTDGTWSHQRKSASLCTVSGDLAEQVRELVVSLGMRARIHLQPTTGFGRTVQAYHVVFRPPPGLNPFVVKAHRLEGLSDSKRSRQRCIQSVTPVGLIRTKCIEVDSPDHTYLCGPQMVPTHNTMRVERMRKVNSAEDYIAANPVYHAQAMDYMRMSGLRKERVLLLSLTYPYEMREFVIEYDMASANQTADKYRRVIQDVADGRVPMCSGCKGFCPAKAICSSPNAQEILERVRG